MSPTIVQPDDAIVHDAVALLQRGGVVAFPTETVYGLGADTFNVRALDLVYQLKGRPADNPLIAHVYDIKTAKRIVDVWDSRCEQLAQQFWPGPLALVVRKAGDVPSQATAGLETIAVRCPKHPAALRLLEAFGSALSAPSANRSGHVSPTCALHVADDFANSDELLIIDGGRCAVGIESTVVDLTTSVPRVLRPGSVTIEQLRGVLGQVQLPVIAEQSASPGTSATHYAPQTCAVLVATDELPAMLAAQSSAVVVLCHDRDVVQSPHWCIEMSTDAAQYAAQLYRALREADAMGASKIVIEQPLTNDEQWQAVHDRLRRATTC